MAMFGGLAFLLAGNMSVAASGQGGLLVRVDPRDAEGLLVDAHVSPMAMRGREMKGWLRVEAEAVRGKLELARWVRRGVALCRLAPTEELSAPGRLR